MLDDIATRYGWKIGYEETFGGSEGYTYKVKTKKGIRFAIFVAIDFDLRYTEENLKRKQRYTIAHEFGHIVLHPEYDWNTLDRESPLYHKLEVEANWFAARLLMPDYIFQSVEDLEPETLCNKCAVNYSAAKKRIERLDSKISKAILLSTSSKKSDWTYEKIDDRDDAEAIDELSWWSEEVAAATEQIAGGIRCTSCGDFHTFGLIEIFPFCMNCGADLEV